MDNFNTPSLKNTAITTIKFAILDGLLANRTITEKTIDAVFENIFKSDTRWAIETLLKNKNLGNGVDYQNQLPSV